ncbi:MAG: tetratricopeptide repeat protein [Acidobacteriaceae bacterium]|nr:tetratricopeptide repeat protein [Acidobacteriaceae bacterium]MBV9498301.1 tetratricopeptide repeat protein [Acidobacteriaceae bacterium]
MTSAASRLTSAAAPRAPVKEDLATLMKAAMTHRDTGRFKEARDIFSAIRALCPTEPHAEIGLGSTYFSEGRFEAAIGHYRQALKLNPCNAYAYALLGESQIFQAEFSGARVSLRRACEIDPKGPYGRLAQQLLRLLEFLPTRELTGQHRQL